MSGETEVKDLAFYAANPSAIGDLSEEQLTALASQSGDTGEQSPESGQPPMAANTDGTDAEGSPAQPADGTQQAAAEQPPEGVATKDGKRIIPYTVLEQERRKNHELERLARDQAERLKQLEQPGGQPAGQKPQESAVTILSEEELQELEEELPAIGKLFRAQQTQLQSLGQTVQTLAQERQTREEEGARTVQMTVQEAIDASPKLAYLQSLEETDPIKWERAVRFDSTLRADPEWAEKSFSERFEKVVQLYEATYGPVDLPGQPAASVQSVKQPSQADLAKQAAEKLKSKTAVPTSLSAIPGGATPATDDVLGAFASKTGPELTADFMRMTPAQIDAALARLQ
jgi:hypothetical protein